ncbi:hypothetical protein [Palleronia sp. THAF1]|nr:hypothetical protein [Palleronia sp. THAF1]
MTTKIAIFLALLIATAIWADLHYDWGGTLYVMRALNEAVKWVAFWR